jgi:NAD dependent epimerase/dehydratase
MMMMVMPPLPADLVLPRSNPWDTFYRGKTVVVTGAGGFIGSHLVEALVALGATVKALVRYNSGSLWGQLEQLPASTLAHVAVVSGDITDVSCVRTLMQDADVVFHLAALIGIPYSYVAPQHYVNVNIQGTLNVLEMGRLLETPKIVHTSTSETYGTAQFTPITEAHPLQGQSPYSASKMGADALVDSYFRSFGTPVATIRPFNTFGPRQSNRAFIPTVMSQLLTQSAIKVGTLDTVRDLNFVSDTVAGFLAIGASEKTNGEVMNIGSGRAVSMREVLKIILELEGKPFFPVSEGSLERIRPEASEVFVLQADATKAKALLGWESSVALEAGLALTLESMKRQLVQSAHKTGYAI